MVSGLNLNNEVFGFYQGSSQFPISASTTSRRTPFGLRWNWDARNEVARKPNRDLKDCVRPTFASREVES